MNASMLIRLRQELTEFLQEFTQSLGQSTQQRWTMTYVRGLLLDGGRKVGIPEDVGYRPKWQLALEMIERAQQAGFSGTVLADAAYGSVTAFGNARDAVQTPYCVGIDSTLKVIDAATEWDAFAVPAAGEVTAPAA